MTLSASTSTGRRHGLLGALPRSYQVTPDIPTGDERHNKSKVRPNRPTASKRVSSPPVGTFSTASDVADEANHKQQASMR